MHSEKAEELLYLIITKLAGSIVARIKNPREEAKIADWFEHMQVQEILPRKTLITEHLLLPKNLLDL